MTDYAKQVLEMGGRIQGEPSDALINTVFARELAQQQALFHELSLVDIAYTLVSLENQLIAEQQGRELLSYLIELHKKPDSFVPIATRGDLYTNREVWLAERTPTVGYLGVGRARREAITAAFLLHLRRLCPTLMLSLISVGQAICQQAVVHSHSLMPDYTYLQVAQPTTFGHYLLGFAYPLVRDLQRLAAIYSNVNHSVSGCGSSNGSRLFLGRKRLAELLGCDGLVTHARDAMWQADIPIEIAALLTTNMINLSRLAEDLQIYCSEEFALVELDDGHARASKIMPQKKNPFALTAIRGLANEIIGALNTTASLARTPSGQPDNRLAIYGLLPDSMVNVSNANNLMAEVIEKLHYDSERGAEIVQNSWAMASDFAEILVAHCDLNFREAHKLIGYLTGQYSPQQLTIERLQQASLQVLQKSLTISPEIFAQGLDAWLAIQQRQEIGGAAPETVHEMIDELNNSLKGFQKQANVWQKQIDSAENNLLQQAYSSRATSLKKSAKLNRHL
jgi:argininosuccinate lyase